MPLTLAERWNHGSFKIHCCLDPTQAILIELAWDMASAQEF